MAVALDSKGGLYESEHHFCGSLRGYRHTVERERQYNQAMLEMGETNTVQWAAERGDLHKLATADDLKSAIPFLLRLGFTPIKD
jgi:recombinational DNA repair protein (RecF pathway)